MATAAVTFEAGAGATLSPPPSQPGAPSASGGYAQQQPQLQSLQQHQQQAHDATAHMSIGPPGIDHLMHQQQHAHMQPGAAAMGPGPGLNALPPAGAGQPQQPQQPQQIFVGGNAPQPQALLQQQLSDGIGIGGQQPQQSLMPQITSAQQQIANVRLNFDLLRSALLRTHVRNTELSYCVQPAAM